MHIETSNYGHRWNSRRTTTISHSETVQRPSSWSSNSVRSRNHRKPHMAHSQSVQSSSIPHCHPPIHYGPSEFTPACGSNFPSDTCRNLDTGRIATEEFGRHRANAGTHPGPNDVCNLSESSCSHSMTMSFCDQPYPPQYRPKTDPKGPDPLPAEIVLKLKERFEKRVLHHHNSKSHDISWTGSASSFLHTKPDKYQLIAAFLVNNGVVEAWHIYAPLPVDVGRTSDEFAGTRMLELTQRRLRLIQRYYSGARQYVILYVNSSYAEHYLPIGLAHDQQNATGHASRKRVRERNSSQPVLFHTGHRLVSRILSAVLKPQRRSRSANAVTSPGSDEARQSPNFITIDSTESDIQSTSDRINCLRRNQSLPSYHQSQQSMSSTEPEASTSNACLPSRSISQVNGNNFIRRVLEHIWTSYARSTGPKSSNIYNPRDAHSSDSATGKTGNAFKGRVSQTGGKSSPEMKVMDDRHEKESSSSGLIDFSSSTGSTTSDHLAFLQTDVPVVSRDDMKPQDKSNPNSIHSSEHRSQIWFPKTFPTK